MPLACAPVKSFPPLTQWHSRCKGFRRPTMGNKMRLPYPLPLLAPGGLLAFHDYPDPGWPDVRGVVDEHAARLGWRRTAQAHFLGAFRT